MNKSLLKYFPWFSHLFPQNTLDSISRNDRLFLKEFYMDLLLTFALSLSRSACFRRVDQQAERDESKRPPAGRCPVIAMRYGGHFSLK